MFPFPDLVSVLITNDESKLTCREIRSLCGNGFHWSAISAMLVFILATSEVRAGRSMADAEDLECAPIQSLSPSSTLFDDSDDET